MMSRSIRRRARPINLDELERRQLLAAPEVAGNLGAILLSQFQPDGFRTTVGTQLRGVQLRGDFLVNLATPSANADPGVTVTIPPINSGLITASQFNAGGFPTVGLQFDRVKIGGGLSVTGSDDENAPIPSTTAAPLVSTDPNPSPDAGTTLPARTNRGLVANSQFSDGGFGNFQLRPDGTIFAREGRVGLQLRNTRIGGSVDIRLDDQIIQPGNPATATPLAAPAALTAGSGNPGQTVIDLTTNKGLITNSQFNDGGFGDLGFQWTDVSVGGGLGTSTNTLFIKPTGDNIGPITVADRVFGGAAGASASPALAIAPTATTATPAAQVATPAVVPFPTTYTNAPTNSGRIDKAQVNDGGFGDVGLQWQRVRVGGTVSAVHNSLTVQPESKGQGFITVRGVRFPTAATVNPRPARGPLRTLPTDPAEVASDGSPLATTLPKPTGPLSPFFPIPFGGAGTVPLPYPGSYPLVNAATNSGLIRGGQFDAGGFGDQGLQWRKVGVGGNVKLVHNSLSVHPEGSGLAGISVSDVSYGPAVSKRAARTLAVLPYAVISAGTDSDATGVSVSTTAASPSKILTPPNGRLLTQQQLAAAGSTDVFLQWNGIDHRRGLVIVHNTIKIIGVGAETGPITLRNIRFPVKVPTFAPLSVADLQPTVTVGEDPTRGLLLNAANNSGILDHNQFSDEGFGDDGLQWNNVVVDGSVEVVHNQLAVDASADLPARDVSGPITVSNVTFNSQVLDSGLSPRRDRVIVSPPDTFQRRSTHPINLGKALKTDPNVRDEATNSGIMVGGQLSAGGANHALLQWQCVRIHGKVRVIDNVLTISVLDRPSGPITISDITFA